VERLVADLGLAQHGVLTGAQLRRRGVTAKQVRHQLASGRLQRLKTDIYRLRAHPWTWPAQLTALLFDAGPGAVVSHRAAAQLHGFWRYRRQDAVEVSRAEGDGHTVSLGRLHRTSLLPSAHRTVVAGFPVTTVARTCFDLFGDPDPGLRHRRDVHATVMRRVLNDALGRRGLTLGQLSAVNALVGGRGRPGSALTNDLLDDIPHTYVPPMSDGESLVMELVESFGIEPPERQVPMSDAEGFIGTVDFLWRDARVVLEIDGHWHDGPDDAAADAGRDDRLRACGFHVLRWPYRPLVRNTGRFLRELRSVLAPIGAETRVSSEPRRAS